MMFIRRGVLAMLASGLLFLPLGCSEGTSETTKDAGHDTLLIPDTMAPDTMAPDTMAPDTMAPDTMAPDTMAPDTMASDFAIITDGPTHDSNTPDTTTADAPLTDTIASGDSNPGPTCAQVIGKPCTDKGGECGSNATCLLTSTNAGVCTCACTPDDPNTTLVNEDSCPNLAQNACGTIKLKNHSTRSFCFQTCDPKLGSNTCDASFACNPRSGAQVGLYNSAVCMFAGCKVDKDCPVITAKTCKTDGSVACNAGDTCIPFHENGTDGLCAKAGKCDTVSGLCAPRNANFKASAKVGDPCKDDTECGANMRCERESSAADRGEKPQGNACTSDAQCCSHHCLSGICTTGLCTTHARNGYCITQPGCAFSSFTAYQCPTGSTCSTLYSGGICFKSCDLSTASACRGNAGDKLGDYECRAWNNISIGSTTISSGPVCEFGDAFTCDTFSSLACADFGDGQNNTTHMSCRDLTNTTLTNGHSPLGLCLDDTASGPNP